MIKKILPAMIGAALVGGMANVAADVTAMGHIDTSVLYQSDDTSAKNFESTTNLVCTTCSFGFKGSEDLGNGLKAIFKIDFQYNTMDRNTVSGGRDADVTATTTTVNGVVNTGVVVAQATNVSQGSSSLTDRDQWLGLESGFGKVRVGSISTLYKSHGAMIDPVYRTVVQSRDVGTQSFLHKGAGDAGQGRATRTIRYDSPTFAGFTLGGTYTAQEDAGGTRDNPFGIGGQWKAGGFLVFADYITSDDGGDDDAYKIGGRFGFDKFAIFGQYEVDKGLISSRTYGSAGLSDGADVWFIGGTAGFGNNLIYASFGQGDDSDNVAGDQAYDAWQLVGVHSLSKRSKVYLGYAAKDNDEGQLDTNNQFTLGMKHTF